MPKEKPEQDDPEQSKRFVDLAKQLEAEGDSDSLEVSVKHLAAQQPEPRRKLGKRKKRIS